MRKQRAFATLTQQEIDQIVDWLRRDTYDVVRDRIAMPRPEGFALQLKSTHPLETLWQRKNTVDKINAKLETGQKLTLSEFESILGSADVPSAVEGVPPETSSPSSFPSCPSVQNSKLIAVHNAILETACDLATSGDNTPFQLLALQKLADFPARDALRARKEERDLEMRQHKIQMDLHRKEMAEQRKQMATERLVLSRQSYQLRKQTIDLRAKQFAATQNNAAQPNHKSEIRNPKFNLWSSEDIIHNQPKVEAAIQSDPFLSQIGLPPNNPPTPPGRDDCHVVPNSAAPSSEPQLREAPDPKRQMKNAKYSMSNEKPPSDPVETSPKTPCSPATLQHRVNQYTLARHHEAQIGKDPTQVGRSAAFNFHSALNHCPCGNHLPCPDHGDFPRRFFEVMPDHADYFQQLEKKKLPYTPIHELLRSEQSQSKGPIKAGFSPTCAALEDSLAERQLSANASVPSVPSPPSIHRGSLLASGAALRLDSEAIGT